MKTGDKVRIHPKVYEKLKSDTIANTSKDTIYKVGLIGLNSISLKPISGKGVGTDGLHYDEATERYISSCWWVDDNIEKSFFLVDGETKSISSPLFCSCSSPNTIYNMVLGRKISLLPNL